MCFSIITLRTISLFEYKLFSCGLTSRKFILVQYFNGMPSLLSSGIESSNASSFITHFSTVDYTQPN